MIYARNRQMGRGGWIILAAITILCVLTACGRVTPVLPASDAEQEQDRRYLKTLNNTLAVNTVPLTRDSLDYNRTVGRRLTGAERISNPLRLQVVGNRVLMAAYPLCPRQFRSRSMMVGIAPHSVDYPTVVWAIAPFGQDDRATLKLNDEILALDGEDLPKGISGAMRARAILAGNAVRGEPLKFRVRRDDEILRITQTPQNFCNYQLKLVKTSRVNADADDQTIRVFSGLMDVMVTDDELAAIIGHETAHNVMRHIPKDRIFRIMTALAKIFGSWGRGDYDDSVTALTDLSFSRAHEAEADYVGIYLSALAGYDPAAALSAWQNMAAIDPDSIGTDKTPEWEMTHPTIGERYTQLSKAVEQIKLKQAAGLPVLPDFID